MTGKEEAAGELRDQLALALAKLAAEAGGDQRAPTARLVALGEVVLDRHPPVVLSGFVYCQRCMTTPSWPCDEIQALAAGLGVEVPERWPQQ